MTILTDLKVIGRADLNPNAVVYQIRGGSIHFGSKLPMIEVCTFNPYIGDTKNVANYFQIAFNYHGKLLQQLKELQKECQFSAPEKADEAKKLIVEIENAHFMQLDNMSIVENYEKPKTS